MVRVNETFPRIKEKDFFVQIPPDLNGYILRCFTHQRSITSDLDTLFDEFQICTSSRKRVNEINEIIQAEMGNTQFILGKKGAIGWGIGDKIMNTKNDYNNDIYNGEFGRVISFKYRTSNMYAFEDDITIKTSEDLKKLYDSKIFIKNCTFQVYYSGLFKTVNYDLDASEVENFQLSYCTTIHKLQGSEFKICVCDVSEFNMITDSRLLYTAITRAKKQFILLSNSMETIDKIVINRLSSKRDTLLVERINKAFE
jgi:ATP-dependent exoDNAse (exonuclease V) alpha subunit